MAMRRRNVARWWRGNVTAWQHGGRVFHKNVFHKNVARFEILVG